MKLQILVPQYHEDERVISPLLTSIAMQQGINLHEDIEVIIVNDGSDVILNEKFLNSFPYPVKYILAEHQGVSGARNMALDNAEAPLVMFCDADDMFYNGMGLYMILAEFEKSNFDIMTSKFIEEAITSDNHKLTYVDHNNDYTFIHGKIFKLAYLRENNLRWNPDFTIHEDSYFCVRAFDLAPVKKYLSNPFYLWKYRPDSVCRKDPEYIYNTYSCLLDSIDGIIESYLERNRQDLALGQLIYNVYRMYYVNFIPAWQKRSDRLMKLNKRTSDFYKKYKHLWDIAPDRDKAKISQDARAEALGAGMLTETMTLEDFLEKLEKM